MFKLPKYCWSGNAEYNFLPPKPEFSSPFSSIVLVTFLSSLVFCLEHDSISVIQSIIFILCSTALPFVLLFVAYNIKEANYNIQAYKYNKERNEMLERETARVLWNKKYQETMEFIKEVRK
jgi:hypothetical protein